MANWDERYSRGKHTIKEPLPLLVQAVHGLMPGDALDLACGAGRHTVFLAERGWQVTAVDASRVGMALTHERAREHGVSVEARVADLEQGEFVIEPEAYDLICIFYYLQRDLFPQIRAGVRPGGMVVAAIHLVSESPEVEPMNPAFLLQPGELRAEFQGWEIQHYDEGSSTEEGHKWPTAEIVAHRPAVDCET